MSKPAQLKLYFTRSLLTRILAATVAGGVSIWIVNRISSDKIRGAQTRFAIGQATDWIDGIPDARFPLDAADLIIQLESSDIDWNSCEIRKDRILDGWGNSMKTTCDRTTGIWTFRSMGNDGIMGTADDIQEATTRKRRGKSGHID